MTKVFVDIIEDTLEEFIEGGGRHFNNINLKNCPTYSEKVARWSDQKRLDFLLYCIFEIDQFVSNHPDFSSTDISYRRKSVCNAYVDQLLKVKLNLEPEQVPQVVEAFIEHRRHASGDIIGWPLQRFLRQIARYYKGRELDEILMDSLDRLQQAISQVDCALLGTEKLHATIDTIYAQSADAPQKAHPFYLSGEDVFSDYANAAIAERPFKEQINWYPILLKAQKANGSKPSKKYLNDTKQLMKALGSERFKTVLNDWMKFIIELKPQIDTSNYTDYGGRTYTFYESHFLSAANTNILKGLIWICAHFHDAKTIQILAQLAERCYRKIPGKGPTAAAVGNACFFALYKSRGLDGIGLLSRLRQRIKQSSAQRLMQKYLQEAADARGLSLHEIEDLAIEDFGLDQGQKVVAIGDYLADLSIAGIGKVALQWIKPDGQTQKTIPPVVKEKYAAPLKRLKNIKKQIEQTITAQRDRLDRLFRTRREWLLADFQKYYIDHGLMSFLTQKIIWIFTHDQQSQAAIRMNAQWVNVDFKPVHPHPESCVTLWHPAVQPIEVIQQWRDFLMTHQIQQPLKQAFREIYLLTEAEINTHTYSNRMAAHLLKQHQFNSLAKTRGWKYAMLGAYDDGRYNATAELSLPEYQLRAEYWLNELNHNEHINDNGLWMYVATDQVRFVNTETESVVPLEDVPVIPFSEAMRDVDLFVGVASVGNDPSWQDSGGLPTYRDYWESYSFGALSEIAKNRKAILSNLIPRLKIRDVATVKGRFVVVQGKIRTYKIHIGSTNILMEPNDQYLCIVPDNSKKRHADRVFIPFAGDNGLSIILSKAFLLAEDDKITDRTITSQIGY